MTPPRTGPKCSGRESGFSRRRSAISLLLVCGGYLRVATGEVYGADGASRVLKVVALTPLANAAW